MLALFLVPLIIIALFIAAYLSWKKDKKSWMWQIGAAVALVILITALQKILSDEFDMGGVIILFVSLYAFFVSLFLIFFLLVKEHRNNYFFYTISGLIVLSILSSAFSVVFIAMAGISLVIALAIFAFIFLVKKIKDSKHKPKEKKPVKKEKSKDDQYFYKNLKQAAQIIAKEKKLEDRVDDLEKYLLEKYQEEPEVGLQLVRNAVEKNS